MKFRRRPFRRPRLGRRRRLAAALWARSAVCSTTWPTASSAARPRARGPERSSPAVSTNLLKQFRNAGQGPAAESWVGTGQNHPVTAEQINAAIGHGKIAEIAQAAGISPEQMSQLLAQALPNLIDKLTPGGHIKQG